MCLKGSFDSLAKSLTFVDKEVLLVLPVASLSQAQRGPSLANFAFYATVDLSRTVFLKQATPMME